MMEFYKELNGPDGPVFLKMNHLARETVAEIERILHTTERPSRGRFHVGRGTDYGERLVEMAVSEIGLCSGHSASGVCVNGCGETTVRGLYAAGDMASVPHNYMLGAFTYGNICACSAVEIHIWQGVRIDRRRGGKNRVAASHDPAGAAGRYPTSSG